MASEVDTISANDGDFYAQYYYETKLLRVVINTPRGPLAEVSTADFDTWLELKSCDDPMRTYLKYYRPKPAPEEEVPRMHKSPAAKKPTPEQAEAARRRAERNKPMGCGMKLFLFYLAASALTVLALFVAEQFKR
jgi:hypothetical protein